VALKTTYIKNVKFKIIKIKTGCQYVGYFNYSENLNWGCTKYSTGPYAGRRLDSWFRQNFFNGSLC